MSRVLPPGIGVAALAALLFSAVMSGAQSTTPGVPDAGGYPAPTPALERGRAVYVLNHCHFCHGTDLTQAAMGATDLMHGALVGADENGNLIGAVVRAGRPNLQTAMPRYDLSATEITELAAYIHFLRRSGRHRELTDPGRGRATPQPARRTFSAAVPRATRSAAIWLASLASIQFPHCARGCSDPSQEPCLPAAIRLAGLRTRGCSSSIPTPTSAICSPTSTALHARTYVSSAAFR